MVNEIPPTVPVPQQSGENLFRFVLNVALRKWKLIASTTVICTIVGGIWGLSNLGSRPSVEAFATLKVRQSNWDHPLLQDVVGTSWTQTTPETIVSSRIDRSRLSEEIARGLVQSAVLDGSPLSGVCTDEELQQVVASVDRSLRIEPIADNDAIRVRVESSNPEQAKRLTELAVRALVEQSRRFEQKDEEGAYETVKNEVEKLRAELDRAESEEWSYRRTMGFQTHDEATEDMQTKYDQLVESRTTRDEVTAKLAELDQELLENNKRLPSSLGAVTDNVVQDLLDDLDDLLEKHVSMSVVYTPDYYEMQELDADIADKKQAILDAVGRLDGGDGGASTVWKERQDLYRQRMDLQLQATSLDIRIKTLNKLLNGMVEKLPELASKSREHERLAQQSDRLRAQFNKLMDKEFTLRTALDRDTSQLERTGMAAIVPIAPTVQQIQIFSNFLVGGLIGFIVGFGLAMILEANDTSIRSIEDVTTYLELEVLGTIPRMRFGKPRFGNRRRGTYVGTVDEEQVDACIVTQHDPKSPISEAYRTLRTNFQFATIREKPSTIMVTSAVPGEGKTTTAVNLAVTMADRGIRVLVVDTDLRRPNVHRVLKMERGPGLADVLRGEAELEHVIRPTRVNNLYIISSGRVPPNPSELIGSDRMHEIMSQLGGQFDLVICDAPSILVVTDPVLMATHVDTVALVVSVDNARRETIQRAKKHLETVNAHVAGVVLNGLEASRRHYYYYYYYYDDSTAKAKRWLHI